MSPDNPGANVPWLAAGVGEVTIEITVRPGSSRRGATGTVAGRLVIAVNSAPDKGKANDELVDYLADTLRLPKSSVMIVRGATSRRKTIRIITHEAAKTIARLRSIGSGT